AAGGDLGGSPGGSGGEGRRDRAVGRGCVVRRPDGGEAGEGRVCGGDRGLRVEARVGPPLARFEFLPQPGDGRAGQALRRGPPGAGRRGGAGRAPVPDPAGHQVLRRHPDGGRADEAVDPARAGGPAREVGGARGGAGDGAGGGSEAGGAEEFPGGRGAAAEGAARGGEPARPLPGAPVPRAALRGGGAPGPGAAAAGGPGRGGPQVRAGRVGALAGGGDRPRSLALAQIVVDAGEGGGVLWPALPAGPGGGPGRGRKEITVLHNSEFRRNEEWRR